MKGNLILFEPGAAAPDQAEPLEAAVLGVSARIRALGEEKRRAFSRLDELRTAAPALRRRRPRPAPPAPSRPVTFYSIEEAAPEPSARQVRTA